MQYFNISKLLTGIRDILDEIVPPEVSPDDIFILLFKEFSLTMVMFKHIPTQFKILRLYKVSWYLYIMLECTIMNNYSVFVFAGSDKRKGFSWQHGSTTYEQHRHCLTRSGT